jgi:peptidyl-prolyl cis-trans isomerase B (cyclophilin B)
MLFSLSMLSAQANAEKRQRAKITTLFGDMIVELYNDTPIHRDNFIKYVKKGWFDGTLFHRVIPGFMAQGGDPNSVGAPPEQVLGSDRCTKLPAEIRRNHYHKKGALASARLPDAINAERQSSGCQFFLVQGYRFNDRQLDAMENEHFKFDDVARAYYKTIGGAAHLDMQYTIFGEIVEGLEIVDLICAMPCGKNVKDRPNTDIVMKVELID